jgi:hypothetical protein
MIPDFVGTSDPYPNVSYEKELMWRVFELAKRDLEGPDRYLRYKARKWFMDNDEDHVFSFLSICGHLKSCPERTRKALGLKD